MAVAVAVRVEGAMAGEIRVSCMVAMHDQATRLAVALTVQGPMVPDPTAVGPTAPDPMAPDPTGATAALLALTALDPMAAALTAEAVSPMVRQHPMELAPMVGTEPMGNLRTTRLDSLMLHTLKDHRRNHP